MARTATAPGAPTTRLGKAAFEIDDRLIVAGSAPAHAEQGLPRPLVVPARGDRALLVRRPAAVGYVPDLLLRRLHEGGRLRRLLRAAARGRDVARRTTPRCSMSFDVRGGLFMRQIHHWAALLFVAVDRRAPAAHLLHRCVPSPARDQLAHRRRHARAGPAHGRHRLLAPRRPAVRHRAPHHQRHPAVDPRRGYLGALRGLRRRLRRRAHHRPLLHRPRAALPGDPAGA